jgi:Cu+-exporting ATPase
MVGSAQLLHDYGVQWPAQWDEGPIAQQMTMGATAVYVAYQDELLGVLAIADAVRPDAAETVSRLNKAGYRVSMLTGDRKASALAIARLVGIAESDVYAELSPLDKSHIVEGWQKAGDSVAMVGDGVNDAPALASAYVGIAVASGSDVAMQTADVTLMRSDIGASWQALKIGQKTMAKIRQNLFWALGYNLVGIPLAAFGVISPALAGGAMAFSSVLVVTNSLALRRTPVDEMTP